MRERDEVVFQNIHTEERVSRERKNHASFAETFLQVFFNSDQHSSRRVTIASLFSKYERNYHTKRDRAMKISEERRGNRGKKRERERGNS